LRLKSLAGRRMTQEGIVVLTGNRFRTQDRNRQDVRARMIEMIREAAAPPKYRRATKPSRGARQRRLDGKRRQGAVKKDRGRVSRDD